MQWSRGKKLPSVCSRLHLVIVVKVRWESGLERLSRISSWRPESCTKDAGWVLWKSCESLV